VHPPRLLDSLQGYDPHLFTFAMLKEVDSPCEEGPPWGRRRGDWLGVVRLRGRNSGLTPGIRHCARCHAVVSSVRGASCSSLRYGRYGCGRQVAHLGALGGWTGNNSASGSFLGRHTGGSVGRREAMPDAGQCDISAPAK
jgi:hypothetical protein